jgi:shikimate kinase
MMNNSPAKPLFLCGMMGSGKSTVGRLLAGQLGIPFHDLDSEIEEETGLKISDIFRLQGEKKFRQIERELVLKAAERTEGVIALGGGALQNQQIVDRLKFKGWLIFLDAPISVLLSRLKNNTTRPILQNKDDAETKKKLKNLMTKRREMYRQSHIIVDCGTESPAEVAEAIIKRISRYES